MVERNRACLPSRHTTSETISRGLIGRVDRWSLEGAARTMRRLLARHAPGKKVMSVEFSDANVVMVYATGDAADALRAWFSERQKRAGGQP